MKVIADTAPRLPLAVSLALTPIVTDDVGVLDKTSENKAVPPPSVTTNPVVGLVKTPALSTETTHIFLD